MIYLKNITKYYNDCTALNDVNLHIPAGRIYGIIGESGAGKSTLVRCINLLEAPDTGQVIVNNQDLTQLKGQELRDCRRNIGMIFQHFNLLSSRTVFDNIAFPLELIGQNKSQIKEAIMPLIELTGLSDKVHHYPSQLSGGQKQRVAIARALASQPKILLCDEATSSLDPNTTKAILSLLKDINQRLGITIIIITHEMDVARAICDNVAVMAQGKIIEDNRVEQIFLNPKSELAQQFVHSVTHGKNSDNKHQGYTQDASSGGHPLLRLAFVGEQASAPIITQTAKKFGVDFSILHGDIETINGKSMGFLLVKLIGPEDQTDQALTFLREQQLTVEVIGYAQ